MMRPHGQQVRGSKPSKYTFRHAHENQGRKGKVWRSPLDREFNEDWGMYFITGSHHLKCECGGIIRIDEHGWAVCENPHCSKVHNDLVAEAEYEKTRQLISMSRFIKTIKASV